MDISPKEVLTAENIKRVCEKFSFSNEEDLYAAVGYHGITAALVATRLTDKIRKEREDEENLSKILSDENTEKTKKNTNKKDSGVRVEGIDNLLVRLAKCCNPVPGDEINGYITKGRGVSVHRADCPNLLTEEAKERFIEVKWEEYTDSKHYYVDLQISGYDRHGLLNEVLQAVNEMNTSITHVNGKTDKNKIAIIQLTILIRNTNHLNTIVQKLKKVSDIYSVTRTIN